jgi:hypothetical protein
MDEHDDSKEPVRNHGARDTDVKRGDRRRAYVALGLALVAAVALVACAGTTSTTISTTVEGNPAAGAQPVRNGIFAPGTFVDLPKPDGARPYGAPTLKHGTWTQSFEVDGLGPAQTMQFFLPVLEDRGWGESPPLPSLGVCEPAGGAPGSGCTYRSVWIRGGETLRIIASPAGLGVSNGTELSLLLQGGE